MKSVLLPLLLPLPLCAVPVGTEVFSYPDTNNPASGNPGFGCGITGAGTRYFRGIAAHNAPRTIVTVLDFDPAALARLFLKVEVAREP